MGGITAGEAKNGKQKGMGTGEGGEARADMGDPLELVGGGSTVAREVGALEEGWEVKWMGRGGGEG